MKHQLRKIIIVIAGALALQLTANAQTSATGVKLTGATTTGAISDASAGGPNDVVIGDNSKATHYAGQTVVIGSNLTNAKENSVQIGYGTSVVDGHETVIGQGASTQGGEAVALGASARVNGNYNIAVGYNAKAGDTGRMNYAIAIGGAAVANAVNAITIGSNLTNTEDNTVMIGDATTGKRLKGVAAGTQPTDAVNKAQMEAAIASVSGGGGIGGGTGSAGPWTQSGNNISYISGNVGINTTQPTHPLTVNGAIRAKEVIVDNDNWADYVFSDDYKLQSLDDVEQHIKETKHLPGIPSAQEVGKQGVSVGDMQVLLLSKIEELTLHQIELNKRLNEQSEKINALQQENATLKSQSR